MKDLKYTISESIVNETFSSRQLTSDDKKNFHLIANELHKITAEVSNWLERDEKNEDSDTSSLAHQLSLLADQLEGEWDEEITFAYYK